MMYSGDIKRMVPKPPKTYDKFVTRFPKLEQAWEIISSAGNEGPLGEMTARLIRLAIAIGALREGGRYARVSERRWRLGSRAQR